MTSATAIALPLANRHFRTMSAFPTPDRPPLAGYQTTPQYTRPLAGPSATPTASVDSPDRYAKPTPLQQVASNPLPQSPYQSTESSSTYAQPTAQPQPPITPLSGNHYPSQPPPSSGSGSYFGVAQTPTDQAIPSPPPTSASRPGSSNANYTPEGVPIVPVGISGGKMFRCVGYGDCSKVFTRSEHLARHIRKHTGERPFPCHCSKAFSRLDNLRQHAATVHADQAELNEQMLQSLASVHAALSQRANREQRARGEVVEVPKNAIERRHIETSRRVSPRQMGAPYDAYGHTGPVATDWHIPPPQPGRPRTGGGYEYYQNPAEGHPVQPGMDAGPSRRPSTSAGAYPGYPAPMYYDQSMRPPTSSASGLAAPHELSQLPYPYRPMSSNGRELPIPLHYASSEAPPPSQSAHGHPPPSPMYPHGTTGPQPGQWTSPPHSAYPPQADPYHAQSGPGHESFSYPPPESGAHGHGYAPPPSPYGYTAPTAYYPPQQYGQVSAPYAPPQAPYPPPPGYSHPPHAPISLPPPANLAHPTPSVQAAPAANPSESPFSYSAPQEYAYGSTYYEPRKRRADDGAGPRKATRTDGMPAVAAASESLNDATERNDPTWFPPNTERRSSLAISALLGSPQQVPRSRPSTAEVATQSNFETSYTFPPGKSNLGVGSSLPATPLVNGTRGLQDEVKQEPVASAMA